MKQYKAIVIGAGVVGLNFSRFLEDSIVLDKKDEIGKPVQCGEAISRHALGLQNITPRERWIANKVKRTVIEFPNGRELIKEKKQPIGYVLEKDLFEEYLAKESSADIRLNSEVVELEKNKRRWVAVLKNGDKVAGEYLIGADGINSLVRKKIFNNKVTLFPALEWEIELSNNVSVGSMKLFFDNNLFNEGYGWIFPKSKKIVNIGVGGKGDLGEIFEIFLHQKVGLKKQDYKKIKNKSGTIPIRKRKDPLAKDKVFLIGDAAGLAGPIFKGGINQGMFSAKIAAEIIKGKRKNSYKKELEKYFCFKEDLFKFSKFFYSLENNSLNSVSNILNRKKILKSSFSLMIDPWIFKNIGIATKMTILWVFKNKYLW